MALELKSCQRLIEQKNKAPSLTIVGIKCEKIAYLAGCRAQSSSLNATSNGRVWGPWCSVFALGSSRRGQTLRTGRGNNAQVKIYTLANFDGGERPLPTADHPLARKARESTKIGPSLTNRKRDHVNGAQRPDRTSAHAIGPATTEAPSTPSQKPS